MKSKLLFAFFLLFAFSLKAQDQLFTIEKASRWGAIDANQKIIIPFTYDYLEVVQKQFAIVRQNSSYGLFDKYGTKLIPVENDTIIPASERFFQIWKDGLVRTYDAHENSFSTAVPDSACSRRNGFFFFKLADELLIFFTNKNTKEAHKLDSISSMIPLQRSGGSLFEYMSGNFFMFSYKDGKKGVVAEDMNQIFPPVYDKIAKSDNKFILRNEPFVVWADFDGNFLFPENRYTDIWPVGTYYYVRNSERNIGVLNSDFQEIIPPLYSEIENVAPNEFKVRNASGKGIVTPDRVLIPLKYSDIQYFDGEIYSAIDSKTGRYGLLNRQNQIVLPFNYSYAAPLGKKAYEIKKSGNPLKGICHLSGEEIYQPQFTYVKALSDDFFEVKPAQSTYEELFSTSQTRGYGVVDLKGNYVITPRFKSIELDTASNLFIVETEDFEYDMSGVSPDKILTPKEYERLPKDYMHGVINQYGEIMLEPVYKREDIYIDALSGVVHAPHDDGYMVATFEHDGKLIEKDVYPNFATIRMRITRKGNFFWRQLLRPNIEGARPWGLYSIYGRRTIEHKFKKKSHYFNNDSDLVLTQNPGKYNVLKRQISVRKGGRYESIEYKTTPRTRRYGIVNQTTGKEELYCNMATLDTAGFRYAAVARAVSSKGRFYLFSAKGKRIGRTYNYVDDFQSGFARVNIGGELQCGNNKTYTLQVPEYKPDGMQCLECLRGKLECLGGKWGVIDANGAVVLPVEYDFLQKFFAGKFLAQKGKKWGAINLQGDTLIEFAFEHLKFFTNPLPPHNWLAIKYLKARQNGKWGMIDTLGNMIVPFEYDDIEYFENEKGIFLAVQKQGNWGMIDLAGNTIIPFRFEQIDFLSANDKHLFTASLKTTHQMFADLKGNFLKDAIFNQARDFKNGYAAVKIKRKGWFFIDKKGKIINPEGFDQVRDFSDGVAAVRKGELWGFINPKGETIIEPRFEEIGDFHHNRALIRVRLPKRFFGLIKAKYCYGYIGKDGKMAIKPQFKIANDFCNQRAIVAKKFQKYGFISPQGKKITKLKYGKLSDFNQYGLAQIRKKFRIGLINKDGEVVLEPEYIKIGSFCQGLAWVKQGGSYGYIDTLAKVVCAPRFRTAGDFSDGIAAVKENRYWGTIDKNFEWVAKPQFYSLEQFKNGYARAKNNRRKWVYINPQGEEVSRRTQFKIPPSEFVDGVAHYIHQKRHVLVDSTGALLAGTRFKKSFDFEHKLARVQTSEGFWGLLTQQAEYLIAPRTEAIAAPSEGFFRFSVKPLFSIYNWEGKEIAPLKYFRISQPAPGVYKLEHLKGIDYIGSSGQYLWQ